MTWTKYTCITGQYLGDLLVFDPATLQWTDLSNEARRKAQKCICICKRQIFTCTRAQIQMCSQPGEYSAAVIVFV